MKKYLLVSMQTYIDPSSLGPSDSWLDHHAIIASAFSGLGKYLNNVTQLIPSGSNPFLNYLPNVPDVGVARPDLVMGNARGLQIWTKDKRMVPFSVKSIRVMSNFSIQAALGTTPYYGLNDDLTFKIDPVTYKNHFLVSSRVNTNVGIAKAGSLATLYVEPAGVGFVTGKSGLLATRQGSLYGSGPSIESLLTVGAPWNTASLLSLGIGFSIENMTLSCDFANQWWDNLLGFCFVKFAIEIDTDPGYEDILASVGGVAVLPLRADSLAKYTITNRSGIDVATNTLFVSEPNFTGGDQGAILIPLNKQDTIMNSGAIEQSWNQTGNSISSQVASNPVMSGALLQTTIGLGVTNNLNYVI